MVAEILYLVEAHKLFWFQRPQVSSESIVPNPCGSISGALVKVLGRQCLPTQINVVCAVVITYSQNTSLSIRSCLVMKQGFSTKARIIRTSSMPTATFFMCLDVTRTMTAMIVKIVNTIA